MKHTNREAFYQRLRDLSDVKTGNINENKNRTLGTLIDFKRGADNVAYGIVKENHNYYIKKSNKQSEPLVEDFAYIGGLENVTEYQYNKLSEAEKQRNMYLSNINEALSHKISKTTGKRNLNEAEEIKEDAEEEIQQAADAAEKLDTAVEKEKEGDAPEVAVDVDADVDEPTAEPEAGGEEDIDVNVDDVELPDEGGEGEEAPVDDGEEETEPSTEPEAGEGDSEEIKEIQKLVGKVTNKIREAELTNVNVKSFINSFLSAFENELPDVEIEDRREMANKILKVVPDEDIDSLDIGDDEIEEGDKGSCSECGFAKYVSERGYNAESLMECPPDEMASLMSGYLIDKDDNVPEEDYENMANLYSPEVEESLMEEYGHSDISEKMKPYTDKLNELEDNDGKKSKIKSMFWWETKPKNVNEEEGEEEFETTDVETEENGEVNSEEEFKEYANTVLKKAHGDDFDPEKAEYMIKGLTNMVKASDEEDWGSAVGILQQSLDEVDLGGLNGMSDPANVETQPNIAEIDDEEGEEENGAEIELDTDLEDVKPTDIQPGFEPMGGGVVKPEGAKTQSVDVQVNKDQGTVNVSMNENESKIRKYIKARLEEKAGKRKPLINENKKSDSLKRLDKVIDEQYELYQSLVNEGNFGKKISKMMGKAGQAFEGAFGKQKEIKEKLPKLETERQVWMLLKDVFKNKLMGGLERYIEKMSEDEMRNILTQAANDEDGIGRLALKNNKVVYVPVKPEAKSGASGFAKGRSRLGEKEHKK